MTNKQTNRLVSLDVFRGITMILMILVNSPGNRTAYTQLQHSVWHGCTLADLVFPFFITIVGISSALVLSNLRNRGIADYQLIKKITKRSLFIFAMGLLLNVLPHHFDLTTLRIPGVLQRIALCYFFSSLLFLLVSLRARIIITAALLIGYWLLLSYTDSFSPEGNLVGQVDRLLLSSSHLYTPMFDPEGFLSTIPAIASALLGGLMGSYLISPASNTKKLKGMLISGLILIFAGWLWSSIFPLNKALWSSSYVLWTTGLALLIYSLCYVFIEIKQWKYGSKPLVLFGQHALLIYMLHVLFLKIQAMILIHTSQGEVLNLRFYITDVLFGSFSLQNASLCYAISYTLLWYIVLKCLITWQQVKIKRVALS